MGEAAQHGQAATDGVGARAEPLVRQRLPGREVGDDVGVEDAAEGGGEVLGLAARRGGLDDLVEVVVLTGAQGDRREVAEADGDRLQDGSHWCDDDRQRPVSQVVIGDRGRVGETAQDGQATTNGVGARAEALVRQRLPGREVGDDIGVEDAPNALVRSSASRLVAVTTSRGKRSGAVARRRSTAAAMRAGRAPALTETSSVSVPGPVAVSRKEWICGAAPK